jgi:hypothetical protein
VVGGIDLVGFLDGAVVEPQDHVAVRTIFVVKVGPSHADRFVCVFGKDSKRACSVETDTADRVTVNVVLVHCSADRRADASPDVRCGLFLYLSGPGLL